MLGFDLRAAKAAWTVFLVVAALYLVYLVRETILVVVYAIFFAYLIYPLVRAGERWLPARLPRTAVIALVFLLVAAIVALAATLLGSRITDESTRLSQELPKLLDPNALSRRIPLPRFLEGQRAAMAAFIYDQLHAGAGQAVPFAKRIGVGVLQAAGNLIYVVVIPILAFMLIKDAPDMRRHGLLLLERSQGKLWRKITADLDTLLAGYVRSLLLLSLAALVAYSAALALMGAPYALLLGGIAALLEFIPFIGPLTAAAVILLVLGFSGFDNLPWVAGFILVYRIFQDYVLNPRLMGQGVEVAPLLVLIGLLGGEQIGGVQGIFLSVPAMAACRIIFLRVREAYAEQRSAPAPSPPPAAIVLPDEPASE